MIYNDSNALNCETLNANLAHSEDTQDERVKALQRGEVDSSFISGLISNVIGGMTG